MLKKVFLLTGATLLLAIGLHAQTATGTIVGAVSDSSNAVVPNAVVTITNKATGNARSLTTNAEGLYSAPALLAGDYEVRVELEGFRTTVRDASVLAGNDTTVNLSITVGTSKEVVTVEAAAAEINYDNNTIAGSVGNQEIQSLPLNGRNFVQLASLEPGVTVGAGATSARNGPITVSILGGGVGTTRFTLDGIDFSDQQDGTGAQLNFSQEMVQEFQLQSVNLDISTGITSTGAVNIVSRSGSNDFHGSAFYFYRDHNMAAYPGLKRSTFNPNPYFVRKNPGFYGSGPIIKNKLFFFFNFEDQNQVQAVNVQASLAAFSPISAIFSSPQTYHWLNLRLDYRLSDITSVFLRYTHDGNTTFGTNGGSAPEPSNWLANNNWSDQMVVGATTTLSPNLVNDARVGFDYWISPNTVATAAQCALPCVGSGLPSTSILGEVVTLGNNSNGSINRINRTLHAVDSISWQKAAHRMRFGMDFEYQYQTLNWAFCQPGCLDIVSPTSVASLAGAANVPLYFPNLPTTISTTADVLNLPVYNITQSLYGGIGIGPIATPGPYNLGPDRREFRPHVYAQDTWKLRQNITVNYGLGYVYESGLFNSDMPKPQLLAPILGANNLGPTQSNKLDFAPSFGLAWSPGRSSKTVVRAGAGLYWDTLPLYPRDRENGEIGPAGNGRIAVTAGVFTNTLPGIVQFVGGQPVPLPVGASLPITTLTNMTLGQFLQIENTQLPTIQALISPTPQITSGPYRVSDVDIVKTAAEIYPPNMPLMHSYQSSIGAQRDLGHDMVLSADWARRQFENVNLGCLDLNHYSAVSGPVIPKCTSSQLFVVGQQCSAGPISIQVPEGRTIYEGLLVKLSKRFSHRYQLLASYAFQNVNSVHVVNLNNYFQGYGPGLARQNLNVSGRTLLPLGFEISLNSSFISAPPAEPTISGIDLSGTGAVVSGPLPGLSYNCLNISCGKAQLAAAVATFNSTYPGTPAPNGSKISAITLPSSYSLGSPIITQDFRLTKNFTVRERYKLSIMGEFFNAFNIANLGGYSFSLGPAFGQATTRASQSFSAGGPRAVQVGARVAF